VSGVDLIAELGPLSGGVVDGHASIVVGAQVQVIDPGDSDGHITLAELLQPVRRKVALKIIKPGMDTRQVIARFEAERQALALMDHPNIAKVLDAGATDAGRPYFVMELVQGVPITEYCDQCNLSTRERLELFITVCQTVQHAHHKGVIHRDLKPTNVLVAIQDGRPAPKIIDFGVAKAIDQRLTDHTLMTGFAQMIGTPTYMSPEQAELSPLGADTRSDIYSLGVLLYELLTGTLPLDTDRLQAASYDELRQMIREEEPPRPSTRISTLAADLATTIAGCRRTDPERLRQTVRGELDWIVMKCLEKDRSRRYDTANDLGRELERYIRNEPVQACPPSAAYHLWKFARRNRVMLMSGGLVSAALVVGTAVSLSQAVRAKHAESLATTRLKEATEARAQAEANSQNARRAVDDMYTQVAEKWLAHQPQMEPLQREFLEKALQFYTGFANEGREDPAIRFETAQAYRRIAEIHHRLGQPAKAEHAFNKAVIQLQRLVDGAPSAPKHRAELAAALHNLGVLLGDTGRSAEEEQVHRRALELEENLLAEFPHSAAYHRDVARGHWFLGQALLALHRREEAERQLRSALASQSTLVREVPANPEDRYHLGQLHLRLGLTLRFMNRNDEGQRSLTEAAKILEALVVEFPTAANYRNELANVYFWHVSFDGGTLNLPVDQAERRLKQAIEIQSKLVADYPSVTDYRYDWFRSQKTLGRTLIEAGRNEEAEAVLRQALAAAEKLSADAPSVPYYRAGQAQTLTLLGMLLTATGRLDDAETAYRDAIQLLNTLVAEVPAVPHHRSRLLQTYEKLESLLAAAGRTKDLAEIRREILRHSRSRAASQTIVGGAPDIDFEDSELVDDAEPSVNTNP
jgi:serine/threonine protein kinase